MESFNIEEISVSDTRMILAALEYYAQDAKFKNENRKSLIGGKKQNDLKTLKEAIENTVSNTVTIKEIIEDYEMEELKISFNKGMAEDEVKGMFMYLKEEDINRVYKAHSIRRVR